MFFRKRKPDAAPEWLIVGLGNPGGEYRGTRHNVGFEVIERLRERHKIRMSGSGHRAQLGLGKIQGTAIALVKPLTYMNLSGHAVGALARKYQLPPERVLVVADDLDMETGRVRLKPKGSAGGHNGHKSIIHALRSQEYPRLKIGIGSGRGEAVDHVLSKFHPDELSTIEAALDKAVDGCEAVVSQGLERAMNVVNEV